MRTLARTATATVLAFALGSLGGRDAAIAHVPPGSTDAACRVASAGAAALVATVRGAAPSLVPGLALPVDPDDPPRVRRKPAAGTLTDETGTWLLAKPRPAGIDLSRSLPYARESLPGTLPDAE